ncbi:hypothetical protein FGF1_40750 [Flavobacteriaceae bacterium GF1]
MPKHYKTELQEMDLFPVIRYVNEYHEGNLLVLAKWFDQAIYMFHYLPEDVFTALERQNTCHILMQLKETLMEIHFKENGLKYNGLD